MTDDPSNWIHCPDETKRERIAREMKEFRERMFRPGSGVRSQSGYGKLKMPRQRQQPPYEIGLEVSLPPDSKFPVIRWETPT